MPVYEWTGRTASGIRTKGVAREKNEALLEKRLKAEGITIIRVVERRFEEINTKKVNQQVVATFTEQLSVALRAGLPLTEALELVASQMENRNLALVVRQIEERVRGGMRFKDALKEFPRCFPPIYVNLASSGEESGELADTLKNLASYIKRILSIRRKIKGAMIYPSLIVAAAIVISAVLLVYVIPVFGRIFQQTGMGLPLPTKIVLSMSTVARKAFPFLSGTLILLVYGLRRFYRTSGGKFLIDSRLIRLPVFGDLILKSSLARVLQTLRMLYSAGIPVLDGMLIAAQVAGNAVIENGMKLARRKVIEGRNLSEAMRETGVFPPLVCQFVRVGESSGTLDEMLERIASFYEEEVEQTASNLTTILEPVVIGFLGLVIGGLIISMYLPVFRLGGAVGG
jgi:type IV pilus assembly protein PilC